MIRYLNCVTLFINEVSCVVILMYTCVPLDASSSIVSGDHEVQKRKAVTSSLAADEGIPNKVFIGEKTSFVGNAESNYGGSSMVSSASEGSDNGAKENHSFKESAKNHLSGIGSSPSSGGMTITPCTESSASEYNDAINISETAVTISKSIEHKKNSISPTSTKEGEWFISLYRYKS